MWDPVCPATARYGTKRVVCIHRTGGCGSTAAPRAPSLRIGASGELVQVRRAVVGGPRPRPLRRPVSSRPGGSGTVPGVTCRRCRAARPTAGRRVWDGRRDRHGEGCAGAAGKSAFTSAKVPTGPGGGLPSDLRSAARGGRSSPGFDRSAQDSAEHRLSVSDLESLRQLPYGDCRAP